MKRARKPRWESIVATPWDDWEGIDPRIPGAVPRKRIVTQLIDSRGRRWIDHGDGPQLLGGVPEVTDQK